MCFWCCFRAVFLARVFVATVDALGVFFGASEVAGSLVLSLVLTRASLLSALLF